MKEPDGLLVIHKSTHAVAEMTQSWMGLVIWLVEFTKIPKNSLAVRPWVIYDDDDDFKNWLVIGEL